LLKEILLIAEKYLKQLIKSGGLVFFSNVETSTREGSAPEKIIIEVKLTEKPTGSLGIGAGYNSSDGTVATFNINERNFLGKGQTVKLDLSTSKIEKQTAIGFEDPSFLGRNLFAGIRVGQTTLTPSSVSLKTDNLYFAPKIGFPLSRDSNLSIEYSFDKEDVKTSAILGLLSPVIRNDLGKKNKSALTFNYNLDKTNSVVTPTLVMNLTLRKNLMVLEVIFHIQNLV